MITSRPISTIHYIEIEKLKVKLDELIEKNKISFYAFIHHIKEEDETKNHIHLFIIPNGRINTDQLREELEFLDMANPTKPIRCLPFKSSKFADWYLYGLHDKAYLLSKSQTRKYHYEKGEFIVSDDDYLNELIHQIDFSKFKTQSLVIEAAKNGEPLYDLVSNGQIPVQQFMNYQKLYEYIFNASYRQNFTHDNVPEAKILSDQAEYQPEIEEGRLKND